MITYITTDNGTLVLPDGDIPEPPIASVVLTFGNYGNAWQRHGNDGLWHSTTGAKRRWSQMLRMRGLVLIYDAPERTCQYPHCDYDPVVDGQHRHALGATGGRMTTDGSSIVEVDREPACEHGVKGCDARPGHVHLEVQR